MLSKHFEHPDYWSTLFKEILDRTQDSSESLVDYLWGMHALFHRYGFMSEDIKLDIFLGIQLRFIPRNYLVNSLEKLEEQCLTLEAFVSDIPEISADNHFMSTNVQEISHYDQQMYQKMHCYHSALPDFIISHGQGDDFLEVLVIGTPVKCLLDSGATRTIVGLPGY